MPAVPEHGTEASTGRSRTPPLALCAKRDNDLFAGRWLDERGGNSAARPAGRQLALTEVHAGVGQASNRAGQSSEGRPDRAKDLP
jgi:hypothetical protein